MQVYECRCEYYINTYIHTRVHRYIHIHTHTYLRVAVLLLIKTCFYVLKKGWPTTSNKKTNLQCVTLCKYSLCHLHLGWHFRKSFSKLKTQSSNVSFHWNVAKETFELWTLSFETGTAFENVTQSGIGSTKMQCLLFKQDNCIVSPLSISAPTWNSHAVVLTRSCVK